MSPLGGDDPPEPICKTLFEAWASTSRDFLDRGAALADEDRVQSSPPVFDFDLISDYVREASQGRGWSRRRACGLCFRRGPNSYQSQNGEEGPAGP